jgi:hypothetical protein
VFRVGGHQVGNAHFGVGVRGGGDDLHPGGIAEFVGGGLYGDGRWNDGRGLGGRFSRSVTRENRWPVSAFSMEDICIKSDFCT